MIKVVAPPEVPLDALRPPRRQAGVLDTAVLPPREVVAPTKESTEQRVARLAEFLKGELATGFNERPLPRPVLMKKFGLSRPRVERCLRQVLTKKQQRARIGAINRASQAKGSLRIDEFLAAVRRELSEAQRGVITKMRGIERIAADLKVGPVQGRRYVRMFLLKSERKAFAWWSGLSRVGVNLRSYRQMDGYLRRERARLLRGWLGRVPTQDELQAQFGLGVRVVRGTLRRLYSPQQRAFREHLTASKIDFGIRRALIKQVRAEISAVREGKPQGISTYSQLRQTYGLSRQLIGKEIKLCLSASDFAYFKRAVDERRLKPRPIRQRIVARVRTELREARKGLRARISTGTELEREFSVGTKQLKKILKQGLSPRGLNFREALIFTQQGIDLKKARRIVTSIKKNLAAPDSIGPEVIRRIRGLVAASVRQIQTVVIRFFPRPGVTATSLASWNPQQVSECVLRELVAYRKEKLRYVLSNFEIAQRFGISMGQVREALEARLTPEVLAFRRYALQNPRR